MNNRQPTKPSNIPWLGQVPEHWEVKRLGDHVRVVNGFPFDAKLFGHDDGWPLIRVRDVLAGRTETYWQGEVVPEARIEDGDLLVGMDGDFHVGIWTGGQAMLNQRVCCIRTYPTLDKRYLRYLLPYPIKVINDLTYATTVKHLSSFDVAQIRFPLPPLPEQRAIATYLDERTARIDGLVARQRRLVQLLKEKRQALITRAVTRGLNPNAKMKDSGVPWLGEVPVGWEVKPLRYLGSFQNGISAGAEYFGSGSPFVNYKDVYQWPKLPTEVEGLANSTPEDQHRYSVQNGDVFFTRTSETIEEIGIASTCMETIREATFSGFLIRFRPLSNTLSASFSKHYFRSDAHRAFFVKEMNLVTRASLGQELLKRLPVLIPSTDEQESIATWIDERCNHIDALITKVEQAVERLQEYRTALISAAVTGKVRVPVG